MNFKNRLKTCNKAKTCSKCDNYKATYEDSCNYEKNYIFNNCYTGYIVYGHEHTFSKSFLEKWLYQEMSDTVDRVYTNE